MAEPLLGVILATSSSRGDHIVFRWPNNPKLFKRYSKVKYYTETRRLNRTHLDDDLDPVRQKAKWDRHDEDEDDHADANSDDSRQSDTPSSSDFEDSGGTLVDDDENRSVRDRAETVISHGRSKTGAAASSARSKSKSRRPLLGMEEATPSVRSADRHASAHKDATDAHDRAPDSDSGTSKELSPEEKARREERATRAYKTYLGYDIEILASILNPRPELAHQKFELVVDDLAFLGHPVAAKGGSWGDQGDQTHDSDKGAPGANDKSASQTHQRGRSGLRKEIRPYDLPDSGNNLDKAAPVAPESQASKHDAVSSTKSRNASRTRMEQTHGSSSSRSQAPLTQFHLVLVLDRPDPSSAMSGMDLSSWLQLYYDNIVFKMTAALFAEQSKSDYVGRETEKLLALRERCMDDGQAYAAYAVQCLGISSLARCIRDLHKSISTSSDAFLTINDRIEVHLQLPPILQDPSSYPKLVDIETELDPHDPIFLSGGGFEGLGKEGADEDGVGGTYDRLRNLKASQLSMEEWCRTTGPYLVPWKTLLLLYDQLEEAPGRGRGASLVGLVSPGGGQAPEAHGFEQLARNFTALFKPSLHHCLNFSDVADLLEWQLYEDVYPMIRHLIYYRQARVIDIPRPGQVYAISPLFDFSRLGVLSRVWAQAFPEVAPLPVFLSQLSSSFRALSALFPARHQRELALDVLIWLLRHDVVVKMHIRLRLIATESVKRRTAERSRERHERHRMKREKRRQRAAKAEARRMRKSQAEEQERRKAVEEAEREARGRSRDGERARPVEAAHGEEGNGVHDDAEDSVQTSGLSVSRPPVLAHPDSVAEAALAAAAIAGSGGEETGRPHHHHHHHHRHHHRHHQYASDSNSGTDSAAAAAASDKVPIPIAPRPQFDELKFERRPVLRSRSPSTAMMATGTSTGLSVSFSNLSERGEIGRRARADTTGSSSSGGGLAHGRNRSDGLSMTPSKSHSRPTTPNVVAGRGIPLHIRDRSIGGSGSSHPSSVEGRLPRARRATSSAGWGGRRGMARSRSPSRARMRVKGFGAGAEVEIDDESGGEEVVEQGVGEVGVKLGSMKLGEEGAKKRRISTASERPDLPPPSESNYSDGGKDASQRSSKNNSASSSSSSSSDESSSDLSLSSDTDTDSSDTDSSPHHLPHRRKNHHHHHTSPILSSSISPSSSPRFSRTRTATHTTSAEHVYKESLIVEPSRASRRENEYIATMIEGKDSATVKHFFRLLPYLNGKHTVDEIEYRVGMRRRDIRRLLVTFREFIITFMHP